MSELVGKLGTELTEISNIVIEKFTVKNVLRYILEAFAIIIATYVIPHKQKIDPKKLSILALFTAVILFILDVFASAVGEGTRIGAGLGIGYNLVTRTL